VCDVRTYSARLASKRRRESLLPPEHFEMFLLRDVANKEKLKQTAPLAVARGGWTAMLSRSCDCLQYGNYVRV